MTGIALHDWQYRKEIMVREEELSEIVPLQCSITEGARRHIRSEAVKLGITMGEYLTRLLEDHAGYRPEQKAA